MSDGRFLIVAIGVSAGGLAALRSFFDAAPKSRAMAFVIIQHLDPSTESRSVEILARHTTMPIAQIEDGMKVESGKVYMIAPDREVSIEGGVLRTRKRKEPAGRFHPIDTFFRSLAADQKERSVAVILSGAGMNGSAALVDIKEQGGVAFAQTPETAEFDAMPRNAIATGLIDKVLAPEAMAAALADYARDFEKVRLETTDDAPGRDAHDLAPILIQLRRRSNLSIEDYKANMVQRRIRRRMGLAGLSTEKEYADYLRAEPKELDKLAADLLILVTAFFRDEEAWKALEEDIIQPLMAQAAAGKSIRAWIAGSAAGQEAYSLAMLLMECAERAGLDNPDFEIFVTDISPAAVARAREGRYAPAEVEELSEERIKRFFVKADDHYCIKPDLRERMVFAPHDLIRDPPFSQLDIAVCRNLLIYLTPETQNRIIPLLHFALRQGGCLFLGSAEHLGKHEGLFQTVSKKWRIYRREGATRHDVVSFSASGRARPDNPESERGDGEGGQPIQTQFHSSRVRIGQVAAQALANRFAPAAALIDRDMNIVYYHGATERFLTQRPGEPTRNLLLLADDALAMRIRRMVPNALASKEDESAAVRLLANGEGRRVEVTVAPVMDAGEELLLVAFRDIPFVASAGSAEVEETAAARELASENRDLREELRALIDGAAEDRETLKAANEEVVSMNEELRATNEELESSKEELQSLNEELETVNRQLRSKVGDLQKRTDDLNNLLSSTEIATLFLDRELRITWFTPAIKSLLNLVAGDIGRAVSDFLPKFEDDAFFDDAARVLKTLIPAEREIRADDGSWRIRRILPYRTGDERIDGLVITFIDFTDRRKREDDARAAKDYAEAIVETVRTPLLILDDDLKVVSSNAAFYSLFQVRSKDIVGVRVYDLGSAQWNVPSLRRLLEEVLVDSSSFDNFEVKHEFESIGERTMLLNARRIDNGGLILLSIEDVTERNRLFSEQRLLYQELNHRVKNTLMSVQAIAHLSYSDYRSQEEARDLFLERLHSLSRVHSLMSDENWRTTSLDALLASALDPFGYSPGGESRNFRLSGPPVTLKAHTAQTFAMAIHELATNAAKYGALSNQNGSVSVTWAYDANAEKPFSLVWTESNGPKVEPPKRKGFGTKITTHMLAGEIGGEVTIEYPSTGVICRVTGRL